MKTLLNLYEEIRPRHVRYNVNQLVAAMAVLLLALAAWGTYSSWAARTLAAERVALESQEQALTPQIETMQSELASDDRVAIMRKRIDRLTLELQGRERMQALIAELSQQHAAGFSPVLAGLGSASRSDAWLNAITLGGPRIDAAPERVRLRGRLLDAQALAKYLDGLAQTETLRGVQFATVIVGTPADPAKAAGAATGAAEQRAQALAFELDTQVAGSTP